MVKQREGYRFVIIEPAKTWLAEGKCGGCGKPKSEWTRTTKYKCCSPECTNKYMVQCTYYGWPDLRMKAIKRDGFKCVKCGKMPTIDKYHHEWQDIIISQRIEGENTIYSVKDTSQLVVDHIHPIALGGEEWSLENLQTLCIDCNKPKTRIDMGEIAKLRLKEQLINAGQTFLDEKVPNKKI